MRTLHLILPLAFVATGCVYEETALEHRDLHGIIKIPREASVVTIQDNQFNEWEIDDPRALGPVYIGVFASIQDGLYDYPHPEQGPVLDANHSGETYPYGGTTVGRFHPGCYEETRCKMVTGRFTDYDDVLDYWANELHQPLTNSDGDAIGATEYQERCYEVDYETSDDQIDFLGPNDFELVGDYYQAEFDIPHTLFRKGVSVWGWMDSPAGQYEYITCDEDSGDYFYYYDEEYYQGTNSPFILNTPGDYIDSGDWIVDQPAVVDDPDQDFEIVMGYNYVE